ncbi:MAG: serine/threonine protein kinase [Euzebyales bacterium]|nr:serine/threonine protein kinase [Euzebyales bacterium]
MIAGNDLLVTGNLTALKLLGGGHRYEAYLAHDVRLLTPVVVKIVRPSRVTDRGALEGLAEEFDALRACNHPSICRGFDAVLDGTRPHIVLEHVEGPRLSTLIRKFGRLDLDQLVALGVQVAAALHYLHGRDVVHLDVKPSNIIMAGPPRLIDLSVACSVDAAARLRKPVGTDAYMAPEQAAPTEGPRVGPAADVWGIGATLHEAVTGQPPFPRPADGDDPYPQRSVPPRPLGRTVPASVAEPISACLDPDPDSRPTAQELVEAYEPMVALPRRIVLGRVRPRWS